MSFAKIFSAQPSLLGAHIVTIEVDTSKGLHAFSIVGLPDKAVEESRDRISAAIKNSGFKSPKSSNKKIVISLAPADLKKEGPVFDVGMALAYLQAVGNTSFQAEHKLFLGELALDGEIRSIRGVLPIIRHGVEKGFTEIFVPQDNAKEAALVSGVTIYPVTTLRDIVAHLTDDIEQHIPLLAQPQTRYTYSKPAFTVDMEDVRGQESAKRGLEIVAAGGHNCALWGPPGTGKTMLARALCGILPPLTLEHALEVTGIHSVAGTLTDPYITHPPFRSPHHTASHVALIGGGTTPRPGEVTLAHRGVLFLDEFPEFDRRVIEVLRQPLEDKVVTVSRAKASARFPANSILVAAMNPCPCGKWGSAEICTCPPHALERYRRKLSGPIVDRIDIWLEVGALDHEKLRASNTKGEPSADIRQRIERARAKQKERFGENSNLTTNSDMGVKELEHYIPLNKEVQDILTASAKQHNLSARSYHRIIKTARTIADLDATDGVRAEHILEALQYRPKQLLEKDH
jgi:magnesium chelatase family protein